MNGLVIPLNVTLVNVKDNSYFYILYFNIL